jgi:hypothetical protein
MLHNVSLFPLIKQRSVYSDPDDLTARAFAWLLIESAAKEKIKDISGMAFSHHLITHDIDATAAFEKFFKAGCRAAKYCLTIGDLELGGKLIERLAERQSAFQHLLGDLDEDARSTMADLAAEMPLLQMTLVGCSSLFRYPLIHLGLETRSFRYGQPPLQ